MIYPVYNEMYKKSNIKIQAAKKYWRKNIAVHMAKVGFSLESIQKEIGPVTQEEIDSWLRLQL